MTADLHVARRLVEHGIPVFAAPPNRHFDPARSRSPEFHLPSGWQLTESSPDEVDRWRPSWAIALVAGQGLDGVDVDPKHGADVSRERDRLLDCGVTILGETWTPSGGVHLYVASTGAGSTSRPQVGLDFRGGRSNGTSRGFLYLPGTSRPKYDGRGYSYATPPDLALLDELDLDRQREGLRRFWAEVGVDLWDAAKRPVSRIARTEPVGAPDLPGWLQELVADTGPDFRLANGSLDQDRSARFFHVVAACQRAGLTRDQIVSVMTDWCEAVG